jgi:ubiquinone/menaquinone biosynthesis C-methylase UbiE
LDLEAERENARVRGVFGKRTEVNSGPFDLYALCAHQERQEVLVRFFRRIGLNSLRGLKLLDVGCGSGGNLRRMIDFGADSKNCFGIDLFRQSLLHGHGVNPGISLLEGTAAKLPFGDAQFDFVFQFTVLTSILDSNVKRQIVSEIARTLRPGGYFVWYDFAFSNPRNPDVRGIGRREIAQLLDGFQVEFQRVTLAPPIGRQVVRISPAFYRLMACFPFLRSHYFCFARKSG